MQAQASRVGWQEASKHTENNRLRSAERHDTGT
jgi:hypothetical protein